MALKGLGELPTAGSGLASGMSIVFPVWLEAQNAAIRGLDCVLSGCAVTGGADMTPAVAKGAVLSNGVLRAVTAADVTVDAADATNPRWDIIVINSSGTKAVRKGTAAAAPAPPALTANDVVLAAVYVPANDTAIGSDNLIDLRFIRDWGPLCIFRSTTRVATNTSAAEFNMLNLTIPNGLFTTGRVLRVDMWGTQLLNSGTPTVTFRVKFGAVSMFVDGSAAATADADRKSWWLTFNISATANNDQYVGGLLATMSAGAFNAATTGYGAVEATAATVNSFGGDGTADADAADRALEVTWQMNVSNAANEMVFEGAIVELF
ncbi:MAG: hypothetical protein ACKVT1_01240 [Dehalococcoidia bacterium]